jgi:hypothetical protein
MNRFDVASGRHHFPDGFFCRRRVIRGDDPNLERPRPVRRWLAATRTKIAPAMLSKWHRRDRGSKIVKSTEFQTAQLPSWRRACCAGVGGATALLSMRRQRDRFCRQWRGAIAHCRRIKSPPHTGRWLPSVRVQSRATYAEAYPTM